MITQTMKNTSLRGIFATVKSKLAAAAKVILEGSHLYLCAKRPENILPCQTKNAGSGATKS
jgi:hypothetical protein